MDIKEPRYSAETSVDEVCIKLAEISSKTERRIIALEIAALMLADNEHDKNEKSFLKKFQKT